MALSKHAIIESVKVLTLNTWGRNGPPERRPLLIQAIRELQPDIALLQEVTDPSLLDELGCPTRLLAGEGWLAIATRFPALRHGSVTYRTVSPMEPYRRQILLAQLDTGAGRVWAGCTHLSWKAEDGATRLAQTEELVRLVSELPEPLLLGGDFNAPPEEPPIRRMREAGFTDLHARLHPSEPGVTWDNRNPFIQSHSVRFPDRRIDYIFMRYPVPDTDKGSRYSSPLLTPLTCDVVCNHPSPAGLYPSDHYGVLALLEMK